MKKLKQIILLIAITTIPILAIAQPSGRITVNPPVPCASDTVCVTFDTSIHSPSTVYTWDLYDPTWSYVGTYTGAVLKFNFPITGYYNLIVNINDPVSGWDSAAIAIFVDTVCLHNHIAGVVFNDANANGVQDPGELGIPNVRVGGAPSGYHTYSNASGNYNLYVATGMYDVGIDVPTYWGQTVPTSPGTYNFNFTTSGSTSSGNDFGLDANTSVNDLEVYYTGWLARPGFDNYATIVYRNVGTTTMSGSVNLDYDPIQSFVSSTPIEDVHSGSTLTWNYASLLPGESRYVSLIMHTDSTVVLGTPLCHTATVNPIAGDTTPDNNVDSNCLIVVGSYDPNDKAVSPAGEGVEGRILPRQTLEYTIRFQNTGTLFAENVRLEDIIDANLDLGSIRMLASSHSFDIEYDDASPSRKVKWHFNDIFLPSKDTDEPGSHGFVKFEIDIDNWASLPMGTEINNEVSIFFDFNAPIITNRTRTTFDNTVGIVDPNTINLDMGSVNVYPNPAVNATTVEFEAFDNTNYTINVLDITGKLVATKANNNTQSVSLNVSNLNAGLYVVQIKTLDNKVAYAKLNIQ